MIGAKHLQGAKPRGGIPLTELTYRITSVDEGKPIRRVALSNLRMSYGQFKRAKFEGDVLLDGRRACADERVREGQTLLIRVPSKVSSAIQPYALPLCVPFQDEYFCVVDKPAPLPSTSSPRQNTFTLENAFYAYLGCPERFVYHPVNRLDKGTSGLMLVALNAHAQQRLQAILHTEGFLREYLAICEGRPPAQEGLVDLPIAKADGASIRRETSPGGKPALTYYRLLQTAKGRSLLGLRLETGRTHQIRVHLAALGCPIVGDFLYGKEHPSLPGRFALHSHRVRLSHPFTNKQLLVESPLPEALASLLPE